MVPRQQVIDYISSNIRSGYDMPAIRSRLIASGYEPNEINSAISIVQSGKNSGAPKANTGIFVVIGIAMVAFLLVAVTAMVFFQNSGTNSPSNAINSGASFDTPQTPVTKPVVSNPSTTNKSSTTSTTPKQTGTTPSNSGTSGTSNFQGSTTVRNTIPSIDYGTGNTQDVPVTRLAIENKVSQLAASKPDEAASLCSQINTPVGQQSCLNNVAQTSEQSKYCTQIGDVDLADACLTSLALKQAEDVNLCKQLKSEIRFRQCVLLYDSQSQLATVQKAAAAVQTSALTAPAIPTDQQIIDSQSVSLDTAIVSSATTQTDTTTTQTTTDQTQTTTSGQTATDSNAPAQDVPVDQTPI